MSYNIKLQHNGTQIYSEGEYIINTSHGEQNVLTSGDLLQLLENTQFGSALYEEINETLLNWADEDELIELDKISRKLYDNKFGKQKSNTYVSKDDYIKNNLGYGGRFFFLKKDFDFLKTLKQEQFVVSAYGGHTGYGVKIVVNKLDIYDIQDKSVYQYTGRIQIFQDTNTLGFGIYNLLDE